MGIRRTSSSIVKWIKDDWAEELWCLDKNGRLIAKMKLKSYYPFIKSLVDNYEFDRWEEQEFGVNFFYKKKKDDYTSLSNGISSYL